MPALTEVDLVTAAAVFVIGLVVGALLARLVLPSRRKLRQLVTALEDARTEHETYRAQVSDHFEKTSDLVATMTASYKAVYDHLAVGAQTLCQENAALGAGRFAAPRLVFDQEVDLARPAAAVGQASTPGDPDAPILEMKREGALSADPTPAPATSSTSNEQQSDNGDTSASPLH